LLELSHDKSHLLCYNNLLYTLSAMNIRAPFASHVTLYGSRLIHVNHTRLLSFCIVALASSLFAADTPLAPGAKPRKEADTGAGEGPVWHPAGDLYFSGGNRITRRDSNGVAHVFREPSGGANGLLFDFQGRLVVCEAGRRRVTRTEPDGSIIVLADNYRGKRFNSPNDLTIDTKGRIYFTDPRYGSRNDMEIRDGRGELVEGVYRIDGIGEVSQITAHEVNRPNGILVSPQDQYLYVADNNNNTIGGARKLWRFDLKADGTVVSDSRKLIFDWETGRGPDGLEMDQAGRLYVAGGLNVANPPYESVEKFKAGIYILSPEGKLLSFVPIPKDEVTNCTFGGADLQTLFITAGGTLWSIPLNTPGRLPYTGK
jgi:gluconolactonase